jgi:hypothetical protein
MNCILCHSLYIFTSFGDCPIYFLPAYSSTPYVQILELVTK